MGFLNKKVKQDWSYKGFLKRKVSLPIEVLIFHILSSAAGLFFFVILVFIRSIDPLLAGGIWFLVSSIFFYGTIIINNRFTDSDELVISNLIATKQIDYIDIFNNFSAYLTETLKRQGVVYDGNVSSESLNEINVNAIFVPIFFEEGQLIAKQFISSNGSIIILMRSLTPIQKEQLIRFFTVNS